MKSKPKGFPSRKFWIDILTCRGEKCLGGSVNGRGFYKNALT